LSRCLEFVRLPLLLKDGLNIMAGLSQRLEKTRWRRWRKAQEWAGRSATDVWYRVPHLL